MLGIASTSAWAGSCGLEIRGRAGLVGWRAWVGSTGWSASSGGWPISFGVKTAGDRFDVARWRAPAVWSLRGRVGLARWVRAAEAWLGSAAACARQAGDDRGPPHRRGLGADVGLCGARQRAEEIGERRTTASGGARCAADVGVSSVPCFDGEGRTSRGHLRDALTCAANPGHKSGSCLRCPLLVRRMGGISQPIREMSPTCAAVRRTR